MLITVELFGIPRERAGTAKTSARGLRLDDVLSDLARQFPRLAEACIQGGQLRPGYLVNLNGQRFVSDPSTPLVSGDSLLILSADAGG